METQDPTQETLGLKFETIHDDEYHKDGTAISKSVYVLLCVCARVSVCMRPCVCVCDKNKMRIKQLIYNKTKT